MTTANIWGYQETVDFRPGTDLTGFTVEAIDGTVGTVEAQSEEGGAAYLVVETGVWIFGKRVLLPAGIISSIDLAKGTVYLARTKRDLKDAPEFDKEKHLDDAAYRGQLARHYGAPHS